MAWRFTGNHGRHHPPWRSWSCAAKWRWPLIGAVALIGPLLLNGRPCFLAANALKLLSGRFSCP